MPKRVLVRFIIALFAIAVTFIQGCTKPRRQYPPPPTANLVVDDGVPMGTLQKVADAHAYDVWGEEIAGGFPFPMADQAGDVVAYVFPYIIGSKQFPACERIFDTVRTVRSGYQESSEAEDGRNPARMPDEFYAEVRERLGQSGSVYVSATRRNFPIIRVSHSLHPYFLLGEAAQRKAERHFGRRGAKLEKMYFLGLHKEYFEFALGEQRILIDASSLETQPPEQILSLKPARPIPDIVLKHMEDAWDEVTDAAPTAIDANDVSSTYTRKLIPHWKLVPWVGYTYWCVPTSVSMVLGFWDNQAKGVESIKGYGRVVDYWFEHQSSNYNVPNVIDKIIDPKTGNWRDKNANWWETVNRMDGYAFTSSLLVYGGRPNHWAAAEPETAWLALKGTIDSGRPALWGTSNHQLVALGYDVRGSQVFVIGYDPNEPESLQEWQFSEGVEVQLVLPGGGTDGDHMVISSPYGGETVEMLMPCKIFWEVWGTKINKMNLYFSEDGGRSWAAVATEVRANAGPNSYLWHPPKETKKGRVRLEAYSQDGEYIAGDGSRDNFTVEPVPLNNWGTWATLGNPVGPSNQLGNLAVGRNKDGRLEVFSVDDGGQLWHTYQPGPNHRGPWSDWASLGHPAPGTGLNMAAIGQHKDGRLETFALALDGAVWRKRQIQPNGNAWTSWVSMGTPFTRVKLSNAAVSRNKDGRLEAFALALDGSLWHIRQKEPNSELWDDWASLAKPPGAAKLYSLEIGQNRDGSLQVFAGAGIPAGEFGFRDVALWSRRQAQANHHSWIGWVTMGKPAPHVQSVPRAFVGVNKDRRLQAFVGASDGRPWYSLQSQANKDTWGPWSGMLIPPHNVKLSHPVPGRNKDGRLEVFATGMSGPDRPICWHIWQLSPNGPWSTWGGLGLPPDKTLSTLAVANNKDGRLEVFGVCPEDGAVWHIWQQ